MTPAPATPFAWTDRGVREALGLARERGEEGRSFSGISTDTRSLRPGDLFVALRGPSFDGHAFLPAARAAGAGGAVVDRTSGVATASASPSDFLLYEVADTLEALGALARHRRRALSAPVLGITGSSGKTTVKDLVAGVLATTYAVHATRGNLNNRVGVPLTLLATPDEAGVVVVEMGTNEPGEIATLAAIAEPDAGVVTTVGPSHLEGLGDLDGVLQEKLDLLRGVRAGGEAVVGDEPPVLPQRARTLPPPVRVAGLSPAADPAWRGELLDVDEEGRWQVRLPSGTFRCGLPGRHGVRSALLALAAGDLLGVPAPRGFPAVEAARATGLRGEIRKVGALTLVVDCYNANPQSTRAALELLADLPAPGGRVAILGSMLELGPAAPEFHREVLAYARTLPLRVVVAVGAFADAAEEVPKTGAPVRERRPRPGQGGDAPRPRPLLPQVLAAGTPEEAWTLLRPHLSGRETILLKASRGVAMERLLPRFQEAFGGTDSASGVGTASPGNPRVEAAGEGGT
jgi:UDP-N-acetylmuramoyl-tripeptide--D-alanyl-D-alanine ligase